MRKTFLLAALAALALAGSAPGPASAGQQAARQNDRIVVVAPGTGGTIITGSPTVLINGRLAARLSDLATCTLLLPIGPFGTPLPVLFTLPIAQGNPTVLINGLPAARTGDALSDPRCQVGPGSANVLY